MILKDIPGLTKEHSDKILRLFEVLPKDSELWLFGSRAKGNFREGSDIDLALKGNKITVEKRDEMNQRQTYRRI